MIYIATIHWQTEKWIDIQLKYLRKNIKENYKVFAFLGQIDNQHQSKFFFSINELFKDHGIKLNILAEVIQMDSKNENDVIIFLDGDAFPINDLVPFIMNKLEKHPLLAINRKENLGDVIAHPAFCATTLKFWKEIQGDWKKGFEYKNQVGRIMADVGGNLYYNLVKRKINWYPLMRTNKLNYHPLFYGIYDDLIYHHGAGFRDPVSSVDLLQENFFSVKNQLIQSAYMKLSSPFSEKYRRKFDPFIRKRRKIKKKNIPIEEKIFSMILGNEFFYKKLM